MIRRIIVLSSLSLFFIPGMAAALGLGEINVNSALNQPLAAEIQLSGVPRDEVGEVKVKLASQALFEEVGLPRPYILSRMVFQPMVSGGQAIIKVTSKDPVKEPFLTFLVEVVWPNGKLLREYTVLLDPPVFGDRTRAAIEQPKVIAPPPPTVTAAPPAPTVVPPPAVEPAPAPPVTEVVSDAPAADPSLWQEPVATPEPEVVPEVGPEPALEPLNEYTTQRGDTLWRIADVYAGNAGVSVQQMMLAIQRNNPGAFAGNNINNLKVGRVLRIPEAGLAAEVSASDAASEVKKQWAAWQQTKQLAKSDSDAANVEALATEEAKEEEIASDEAPVQEEGLESPVEEALVAGSDQGELSILGEEAGAQGIAGENLDADAVGEQDLMKELALLKEISTSKELENTELKERVQALEAMLSKQERVITLQNEQLSALQGNMEQADSLAEETQAALDELSEDVSDAQASVEETAELAAANIQEEAAEVADVVEGVESAVTLEESAAEEQSSSLADEAAVISEPASQAAESEIAGMAEQSAEPVVVNPEIAESEMVSQDVVAEEPSLVTSMMDKALGFIGTAKQFVAEQGEKAYLAGGAIVAALLALLFMSSRRKKRINEVMASGMPDLPASDSSKFAGGLDDTVVAAPTQVDEVFDNLEEVAQTEIEDEDEPIIPEKITDEVIEEADVYISYGLTQQAEDLLSDAIEKNPGNTDYKVKLAEVYHAADKSDEFVAHVEGVKHELQEDKDAWQRVVAMGAVIAPSNALFADASADVEVASAEPAEPDFDIGGSDEAPVEAAADDDMSLDFPLGEEDGEAENATDDAQALDAELSDDPMLDEELDTPEQDFDHNDTVAMEVDVSDLANDLDDSFSDVSDEMAGAETEIMSMDMMAQEEDGDAETAIFDSGAAIDSPGDDEDESIEVAQENLTRELETLNFESPDFEEGDLPAMQTKEMRESGLDELLGEDDDALAASETGNFNEMGTEVTEQFDISDIDTELVDLQGIGDIAGVEGVEAGEDSLVEETGTKLDLAKAFADMGDSDAAKETLTEVLERGDETQIREAKELLEKLT